MVSLYASISFHPTYAAEAPTANNTRASNNCGYTVRAWTNSASESPITAYPMTATQRTPKRSDKRPQAGQAIKATTSSTKPRVPTTSPTPFFWPMRSVMTKETELLRKTRKEMEKSEMPRRYVIAWRGVVEGAKGRRRRMVDMVDWRLGRL